MLPSKSVFEKKPTINVNLRENCQTGMLKTNLMKIRINNVLKFVYIYSIAFDNTVVKDNAFIKRLILRNISISLREKFEKFITAGENLFSTTKIEDEIILLSKVIIEEEEKNYEIKINLIKDYVLDLQQNITSADAFSQQKKIFIEILIKNILHRSNLIRMKRIYFDRNKPLELNFNGFCKIIFKFSRKCIQRLSNSGKTD